MFKQMNTSLGGPIIALEEGESIFAVVHQVRETTHKDMRGHLVDCSIGEMEFTLNGHTALVKGLLQTSKAVVAEKIEALPPRD